MNRETKVGLITGMAIIVMVGMLLSSYLNHHKPSVQPANMSNLGSQLRQRLLHPMSFQQVPMPANAPAIAAAPANAPNAYASATPIATSGTPTPVLSMPGYTSSPVVTLPPSVRPHFAPVAEVQTIEQTQTSPSGAATYRVRAADTLSRIAWHFYRDSGPLAIERIVRANPGKLHSARSMLRVGEKLHIPGASTALSMPQLMAVATSAPAAPPAAGASATPTHTCIVKPGDTLYRIALREMGSPSLRNITAVKKANHIANARDLRVGEKLIIP